MRQTLNIEEKIRICAELDWPCVYTEEEIESFVRLRKKKWVLSDNPMDDDLKEADEEDYPYPFKLLIKNCGCYEALTVNVLNWIDIEKKKKFKSSRYFKLYQKQVESHGIEI